MRVLSNNAMKRTVCASPSAARAARRLSQCSAGGTGRAITAAAEA